MVAVGAVLRVSQYASDRSLWMDEIFLAANVANRGLWDLVSAPLDYGQGAPPGFLAIQRLVVVLLGDSEAMLRLCPFVAGLLSLPLLLRLAHALLPRGAACLAMALFALSPSLVFYSSEAKQYGMDVFVILVLCGLVIHAGPGVFTTRRRVALAIAGGAAVWFSHAAIFALSAIAVALLWTDLDGRGPFRRRVRRLLPVAVPWAVSFALNYAVSLRALAANQNLHNYWSQGFPPADGSLGRTLTWLVQHVVAFFRFPAGIHLPPAGAEVVSWSVSLPGVLLLAFAIGCGVAFRREGRWVPIAVPFGLALLAASIRQFPFSGRLILFLAPLAFLLVAAGVAEAWRRRRLVGAVLAGFILLPYALMGLHGAGSPIELEETRPLLEHIRDRHESGDRVYVYRGASPAYQWYAPRLGLDDLQAFHGGKPRGEGHHPHAEMDTLAGGGRTWIVFTHVMNLEGVSEDSLILERLAGKGTLLEEKRAAGASLYLFRL
jgi:hypothetical protein